MKLAIGTAQFGLDYGVSNTDGQVSEEDVDKSYAAIKSSNHNNRYSIKLWK